MLEWMLVPALAALTLGAVFIGGGGTPDDDELKDDDDIDLDEADAISLDLTDSKDDLLNAAQVNADQSDWLWPEAAPDLGSDMGAASAEAADPADETAGQDDFVLYLGDAAPSDAILLDDFKPGEDSLHVLYDAAAAPDAAGPAPLADAISVLTTPEGATQILGDGDLLVEIKGATGLQVGVADQGADGPVTTLAGEPRAADSFDVIVSRAPLADA